MKKRLVVFIFIFEVISLSHFNAYADGLGSPPVVQEETPVAKPTDVFPSADQPRLNFEPISPSRLQSLRAKIIRMGVSISIGTPLLMLAAGALGGTEFVFQSLIPESADQFAESTLMSLGVSGGLNLLLAGIAEKSTDPKLRRKNYFNLMKVGGLVLCGNILRYAIMWSMLNPPPP